MSMEHNLLPDSAIQRARSDIVGVVGKYVKLEKHGKEYKGLCPFHKEKTPSFSVMPHKGAYYCFGCGAGGDAIDFVAEFEDIPFRDAVAKITGSLAPGEYRASQREAARKEQEEQWLPIAPVPPEALKSAPRDTISRKIDGVWQSFTASGRWEYTDLDGNLIGYTLRFTLPGGRKEVMPLSYCVSDKTREMAWRWLSFGKPRPLYGLAKLKRHPNAQVILVEGEKTADAAQALYEAAGIPRDKLIILAWPGGGKAIGFVDWTPLEGRSLALWPDADRHPYPDKHPLAGQEMPLLLQPGTQAMLDVAKMLPKLAKPVKIITPPADVADGWDLADPPPDGFSLLAHSKAAALVLEDFLAKHRTEESTSSAEPDGSPVSVGEAEDERRKETVRGVSAERAAVAELNKEHALVVVGDKAMVLREDRNELGVEVRYLSVAAFKLYYRNQKVAVTTENKDGSTRVRSVSVADLWLDSVERRTYKGLTFAPVGNGANGYYNLWHGFAVEPLPGSQFRNAMKCRKLLSHLKLNVCRGNKEQFRYLLAWAADMLQDPDKKKGVALVLRGGKGVGKSMFAEALSALLGGHAIKVSQMKHLIGNFNRHLADKLLVVAEETFWAGNKADVGPLQDMITSSTMTVEAKGVDAIQMRSLSRIIMITNDDWAVPASKDERRYFVLDVSDKRQKDSAYFGAMSHQLYDNDRHGLRALLSVLLNINLSKVDLRKVPETDGLRVQRTLSLDPHDQFILDALIDKHIAGVDWGWSTTVEKEAVYEAYVDAGKKRGKAHLLPRSCFAKHFIRCTDAKQTRPKVGSRRPYSWALPKWEDAVKRFEAENKVDVISMCAQDELAQSDDGYSL
ncbi:hypothetical protein E8F11_22010 [Pseudomonas sp. BN417]|uniref:CHC2 zinc finger domain-containing protein n=1 Tax=Pseudomonas sp. BN417 TaxID=2567890 RepID=UPI00245757CF|nr:CHC2 zinc finger domain-containing protein [Pseudomonas sp. BN417]MDH4557812.1 hypothetical protein [Pseudomonas sp. BN417]